jgi:hypothetical protein
VAIPGSSKSRWGLPDTYGADDTGIKVLDGDTAGGSKRGHLWCYVGDAIEVVFRYTPDWSVKGRFVPL